MMDDFDGKDAAMRGLNFIQFCLFAIFLSGIQWGCTLSPVVLTQEEIDARASRDRSIVTEGQEPVSGPIDLYEAIARALKYNLDVRAEMMKTMVAHQQLNLAHFSLLPDVVANGAYDGRSNFAGGRSQSLLTGRQSLEASTASDRNVFSSDLTLSWDVLDFGLSYIRAKQASNDVLIAEEEKRRVANRITQDVRRTYWEAVSAQRLMNRLAFLDEWVAKALERSKQVQEQQLESPLKALQYQRNLINAKQDVQRLFQDLASAKFHLAELMNLPPGEHFELEMPEDPLPRQDLGEDMEALELQALRNRPELRVVDYQRRINADETKAAILEILPSLNLQVGGNYNSNSFLFNNNWLAYGAKVSWNLMSVFRQPAKFGVIEAQKEVLDTQSLALTMTIMTQVHVSLAQLAYTREQFDTVQNFFETQQRITKQTRHSYTANRVSEQTLIQEQVNLVAAEVKMNRARANLEAAYVNFWAAIGEDPLPRNAPQHSVFSFSRALRRHWEVLNRIQEDLQEPKAIWTAE